MQKDPPCSHVNYAHDQGLSCKVPSRILGLPSYDAGLQNPLLLYDHLWIEIVLVLEPWQMAFCQSTLEFFYLKYQKQHIFQENETSTFFLHSKCIICWSTIFKFLPKNGLLCCGIFYGASLYIIQHSIQKALIIHTIVKNQLHCKCKFSTCFLLQEFFYRILHHDMLRGNNGSELFFFSHDKHSGSLNEKMSRPDFSFLLATFISYASFDTFRTHIYMMKKYLV